PIAAEGELQRALHLSLEHRVGRDDEPARDAPAVAHAQAPLEYAHIRGERLGHADLQHAERDPDPPDARDVADAPRPQLDLQLTSPSEGGGEDHARAPALLPGGVAWELAAHLQGSILEVRGEAPAWR